MTYWHGGTANIRDFILPASITGAPSLSAYGATCCRRDRVYLVTNQLAALLYAAGQKDGMIYECEPMGLLEPDPDCTEPGLSWQCEKARIIRCIKPKPEDIEKALTVLLDT